MTQLVKSISNQINVFDLLRKMLFSQSWSNFLPLGSKCLEPNLNNNLKLMRWFYPMVCFQVWMLWIFHIKFECYKFWIVGAASLGLQLCHSCKLVSILLGFLLHRAMQCFHRVVQCLHRAVQCLHVAMFTPCNVYTEQAVHHTEPTKYLGAQKSI